MTKLKAIGVALFCVSAAVLTFPDQPQAQTGCTPYAVNVPILQVLEDPEKPEKFISVLQSGDTACVSDQPPVGPQRLGYVVEKVTDAGETQAVGGWASLVFLSQVAEAAAAPTQTATPTAPDQTPAIAEDDILRFDQPIPYGAQQVQGKTLAELIEGQPMFAPIEGLDPSLWQKNCSSCHQWNAERLCEQGLSYIPRAAEIFRHQHPYGGAYKLSLMRWAKTGCK